AHLPGIQLVAGIQRKEDVVILGGENCGSRAGPVVGSRDTDQHVSNAGAVERVCNRGKGCHRGRGTFRTRAKYSRNWRREASTQVLSARGRFADKVSARSTAVRYSVVKATGARGVGRLARSSRKAMMSLSLFATLLVDHGGRCSAKWTVIVPEGLRRANPPSSPVEGSRTEARGRRQEEAQ